MSVGDLFKRARALAAYCTIRTPPFRKGPRPLGLREEGRCLLQPGPGLSGWQLWLPATNDYDSMAVGQFFIRGRHVVP